MKEAKENVNAARQALNSFATMLEYLQVTAPFDGTITERNVHPGALVGLATDSATSIPMLRLETTDHMRLTVPVPQAYLSGIQGGQKVEFKVRAYPDQKFIGTIARISDSLDRRTRTMPVELDVWNRDGLLTPGTYAQVQWPSHRVGTSLVVPKNAVATDLEHSFVIRVSDGKTQWVNVQVGLSKDDLVEVFGALKARDLVLARATYELRPDTAVVPVHEAEK